MFVPKSSWRRHRINDSNSSLCGKAGKVMNRLLPSVNMFVGPSQKEQVVMVLSKLNSIEEICEVTGKYDAVSPISASCFEEFRDVLRKKIMKTKGIRSRIIPIVLDLHKGPKCPRKNVNTFSLKWAGRSGKEL